MKEKNRFFFIDYFNRELRYFYSELKYFFRKLRRYFGLTAILLTLVAAVFAAIDAYQFFGVRKRLEKIEQRQQELDKKMTVKLDSVKGLVSIGNREHQTILDSLSHHRHGKTDLGPIVQSINALTVKIDKLSNNGTKDTNEIGAIDSLRNDHRKLGQQLLHLNAEFGTYTTVPDKESLFVKILGWAFFILMIASGVAFFFVPQKKKVIFASATVISAICSTATRYLFKPKAKFSFEPQICLWCDCETKGDTVKQATQKPDSIYVYIDSIGPFAEGEAEISTDKIERIKQFIKDKNIVEVDLIGGVDKRSLQGIPKKKYRDNLTLAQSRAEFVKRQLEIKDGAVTRIIPNGASFPELEDEAGLAKSRYVTVIAKYKSKLLFP